MTEIQAILNQVMEECCEVGQRASKAIRFGLDEVQPGQEMTNAERLVGEFIDLCVAMKELNDKGLIKLPADDEFDRAFEERMKKALRYRNYSRERGQVAA